MLSHIKIPNTEKTYLFPGNGPAPDGTDHAEIAAIRFVQSLGIRPNLSGYQLLISAITLALHDPALLSSMTRALYPAVAAQHGCNVRAVERNIRRAIESAYEYDPERIRSVFYFKVKKPYLSEVISVAVENIRCEGGRIHQS